VITTALSFDSLFSSSTTTDARPNFDDHIVVAIKAQTTTNSYKVSFKEMMIQGRVFQVYFTVAKEKPDDENAGWVSISTIPRNRQIRRVNFFHDQILVRSIPVVEVY
jgi:hypothetical protein